jgi:hypothetical protein
MLTALFADIKGSTELVEDLDPERARAIIDPAFKLMIRRCAATTITSCGVPATASARRSLMRTVNSARRFAALPAGRSQMPIGQATFCEMALRSIR